jgi:predicted ribosomally synthesized peptide with nif11-like leader
MGSESILAFNDRVAASPELQLQLQAVNSPIEFLALAKSAGFDLNGEDVRVMVQQAYQQWLTLLDPKLSEFFSRVRNTKAWDDRLKLCRSTTDAIALARECGIELSAEDIKQAAVVAKSIPGFSFEKLWFRRLGTIG